MLGVSFIVTLYNKTPFIPAMIQGLGSQQGDFFKEYIFIDDGSTDGSLDLVRSLTYDWENVIYLQQQNQGPAIATNNAVKKATQPYLKMLDADDVLAPNATELFLMVAEKTHSAVVYSKHHHSPSIIEKENLEIHTLANGSLMDMNIISAGSSNSLYRRDAFLAVGGCDESIFIQDVSLPLRIILRYPVSYFYADVVHFSEQGVGHMIHDNLGQVLHDINAAFYNIIQENKQIPRRDQINIARKAAGRAWKWARRKQGKTILSRYFWIYALLSVKIPLNPLTALAYSKAAFCEEGKVRKPKASVKADQIYHDLKNTTSV